VRLLEALTESHPELADAHFMLGTILHSRKRFEDARDSYLLASCFRNDWWRPHFALGLLALDQHDFANAMPPLRRAIELGANNARVHNALGASYLCMGDVAAAVDQFRKALALQPDLAQAHSNLGYALFRDLGQHGEGASHIERAIELAPHDDAILCNRIMVLDQRGRTQAALELSEALLGRNPTLTEARLNRALMLLKQRDFERAWPDYEARKQSLREKRANDLPWPEWDGSSLAGRSIYVYPEQGLGDEIMFASCLPDLIERADACTVECHAKLEAIFRRSFPEAQILAKNAWRDSRAIAPQPPDCKVAIGSLPLFFRASADAFPAHRGYLRAEEAKVLRWTNRLAALPGSRKIGISWRGGLLSTRRGLRSIPLQAWEPVLTCPDIDFISLQYSDADAEIEALRQTVGVDVHHWQDAIDDYDETAALVAALDLVISVQTAIVHLAGALGKTTWALITAVPEWRYGLEGPSMPWYPAVTLIRQTDPDQWDGVLAAVREGLLARSLPVAHLP
jgi:Flp pilus assembly protein TadD